MTNDSHFLSFISMPPAFLLCSAFVAAGSVDIRIQSKHNECKHFILSFSDSPPVCILGILNRNLFLAEVLAEICRLHLVLIVSSSLTPLNQFISFSHSS
jgi:hypothetical protein